MHTHHESRKFVTFFEPNESCDENGKNISILVNTYYQILPKYILELMEFYIFFCFVTFSNGIVGTLSFEKSVSENLKTACCQ